MAVIMLVVPKWLCPGWLYLMVVIMLVVPNGCAQVGRAECEPAQPRAARELHQLFECLKRGRYLFIGDILMKIGF